MNTHNNNQTRTIVASILLGVALWHNAGCSRSGAATGLKGVGGTVECAGDLVSDLDGSAAGAIISAIGCALDRWGDALESGALEPSPRELAVRRCQAARAALEVEDTPEARAEGVAAVRELERLAGGGR